MTDSKADEAGKSGAFNLDRFFPYLTRIYYRAVSESVSSIYTEEFGLTASEWRTMAVLGSYHSLSASDIVAHSSMDKVNVSRAVKGLQARGFLKRDVDDDDRRRAVLRLTDAGQKAFNTLVPMVRAREDECLAGLTAEERTALISMMEKVRINATNLLRPNDKADESTST